MSMNNRLRKGLLIGATAFTALLVVANFWGAQIAFYGYYLFQDRTVVWNGFSVPTEAPIAVPPRKSGQLVLKIYRSDWKGLKDATFIMRDEYEERLIRMVKTYCEERPKDCQVDSVDIGGVRFDRAAFYRSFEKIEGEYHVHFWSSTPPITLQYHGDHGNFGQIEKVLMSIRSVPAAEQSAQP